MSKRYNCKAKHLTENLLAQLLKSIQGGLAELISSNCKDQITLILKEIKEKDQDIFSDITNSQPETTIFDQIDSFKQLIDQQLTELTILTARYNDFKAVLTAIKAFEQDIINLRD